MYHFNFKDLKKEKGVYLFYVQEELAYIGKSSSLRKRLNRHFNPSVLDYEEWKKEINKIEYYPCLSNADADIIETYLINTLYPRFNKDKVFLGGVNLKIDLPEKRLIQPRIGEFKKKPVFKPLLKKYVRAIHANDKELVKELEDLNLQTLDIGELTIKEIVDKLGTKKIIRLAYEKKLVLKEMLIDFPAPTNIQEEVQKVFLSGVFYPLKEIKKQLQAIYTQHYIFPNANATHIRRYLKTTNVVKRQVGDNLLAGFIIC